MPRHSRRDRQVETGTQKATGRQKEMFEGESSHLQAKVNMEENIFEKKYGIERLKVLGETTSKGTTDLVDAEGWLIVELAVLQKKKKKEREGR